MYHETMWQKCYLTAPSVSNVTACEWQDRNHLSQTYNKEINLW